MRQLLWFAGSLALVAACGVQLEGADNDEPTLRDAGNDANTGSRGDAGTPPPSPDAGTPNPGTDAGPGTPDASEPELDAGPPDSGPDLPDARVPVCDDQAVSGRFCPTDNDAITGATCTNLRNASNYTAVYAPSSASIGAATLNEAFDPDNGFQLEAKMRQVNGKTVTFALLLGAPPQAAGTLCERIDASQAAVVYWRRDLNDWRLRLVTSCDQVTPAPSPPGGGDAAVNLFLRYENGKLFARSTGAGSVGEIELPVALNGPLQASVVVVGADEGARIEEIKLTCNAPPD